MDGETFLYVLWFVSFCASVYIGLQKGEGMAMGFLALFFGPLAIPVALLSKGHKLPCPYCAEKIPAKAVFCKHCHHEVMR